MGIKSQRKGKRGEEELAEILNGKGYEVKRGASQNYGTEPDISGLQGIHIEVKRSERLNLSEAMKQAVRDAERFRDGKPAVFHRKNREGWLCTMQLSDWIELYELFRLKAEAEGLTIRDDDFADLQKELDSFDLGF